jgi:caffeoyl-CoA O-methyltransferase
MSAKTENLSDEMHAYVVAHGSTPDPLVAELVAETWRVLPGHANMQVAPEQARFMTLFTRITGARHAVEVGTFTGLSALSIARGLPEDGRLVCLDVSAEYTSIARRYWDRAGVGGKIELRLGPAVDSLRAMPAEPHVDLAFIDADKTSYPLYWSELVPRMRPGGVILVDNVLRHGRVLHPDPADPADTVMVAFNDLVVADDRVESVMIPLADGVTIARRR